MLRYASYMSFDCPRCWNLGAYFAFEFRRYLRCTMCNANFYDKRSGEEIAAAYGLENVPVNGLVGSMKPDDFGNPDYVWAQINGRRIVHVS